MRISDWSSDVCSSDLQKLLLLGDLERQMRGDRIRQLAEVLDLVDRDQHLRRDLLVQLDILLELRNGGPAEGFQLLALAGDVLQLLREGLEEGIILRELVDARPSATLDQHLDRAVRQLEKLQPRRSEE